MLRAPCSVLSYAYRFALIAYRLPLCAYRFPLTALRLALGALRLPLTAYRLPLSFPAFSTTISLSPSLYLMMFSLISLFETETI